MTMVDEAFKAMTEGLLVSMKRTVGEELTRELETISATKVRQIVEKAMSGVTVECHEKGGKMVLTFEYKT